VQFPTEQRFRTIKTTNKVFKEKITSCENVLALVNKEFNCSWFVNFEAEFVTHVPVCLHDDELRGVISRLQKLEGGL